MGEQALQPLLLCLVKVGFALAEGPECVFKIVLCLLVQFFLERCTSCLRNVSTALRYWRATWKRSITIVASGSTSSTAVL